MEEYIIEYSKESKKDLIEIKDYLKNNLQEPKIAQNLVDKIISEIRNLKNNPKKYAIIDEEIIRKFEIRKLLIDNYIVFYRVKEQHIQIVRIMYGKRNWIDLL